MNRSNTRTFGIFLAGICVLIGVVARIIAVQPLTNEPLVQAPFNDDGFYYLQIARNVATQGLFTFDGINRTNGFHPLWQLLISLIARFSVEDFQLIRLVMYFGIALFALTGVLLYKFVAEYGGPSAGLVAVILWSFSPDLIMWQNQGMENSIYLPLLIFCLIQVDRFIRTPTRSKQALILGMAFGFLAWSRSDSILFVAIALIGIVIFLRRKIRFEPTQHVRTLSIVVGLVFVFGIGYLLFNDYAAGSFLSVSGVVKLGNSSGRSWQIAQTIDALNVHLSTLGALFSNLGGLKWWGFNWRIIPFKLFIGVWTLAAVLWWGSWLAKTFKQVTPRFCETKQIALALLLIYTIIHTVILVTMLGDVLMWTPWYIVPQVVTVLVVLPLLLFPRPLVWAVLNKAKTGLNTIVAKGSLARGAFGLIQRFRSVIALILFVSAVLVPCIWVMFVPINEWFQQTIDQKVMEPRYELGVWLRDHVSSSATVGMFDAGVTGYFAHTHVVNLDGLVNSPEYVSIVKSGDYADYIIDNRFDYLIEYYYPPYEMKWHPSDDSIVCHKLIHINKTPALWGADRVNNYFEVMALRYDGACHDPWEPGFPLAAVPPR